MQMKIELGIDGCPAIVRLHGKLDSSSATAVETAIINAITPGATRLVIDCAHLDFLSSAGIRTLITAIKKMKVSGGTVALVALQPNVREILEISSLLKLFQICATTEDALK